MPGTDNGAIFIASYITGNGGVPFDNTNAVIGVGDDGTAFVKTQTQLQAEAAPVTDFLKKGMVAGYPVVDPLEDGSTNKVRFAAAFGTSEANFIWNEYSIENGAGVMLTRKAVNIGTKTSAAQWVLEVDLTFSV